MTLSIVGVRVRSPLHHVPCYERDVPASARHLVSVTDHAFDSVASTRPKQYIVYEDDQPIAALAEGDFSTAWISGDAPLIDEDVIDELPVCEWLPGRPTDGMGRIERCRLPDGRIIERWFALGAQPGEWTVALTEEPRVATSGGRVHRQLPRSSGQPYICVWLDDTDGPPAWIVSVDEHDFATDSRPLNSYSLAAYRDYDEAVNRAHAESDSRQLPVRIGRAS